MKFLVMKKSGMKNFFKNSEVHLILLNYKGREICMIIRLKTNISYVDKKICLQGVYWLEYPV